MSVVEYADKYIIKKQREFDGMDVADYRWIPLKAGYIMFSSNQAYFLNIKSTFEVKNEDGKLRFFTFLDGQTLNPTVKIKSHKKIDFQIGTTDLTIEGAYECKDPEKVVFRLTNFDSREHVFLVWDLAMNKEIRNFSTKGDYRFVQGENSTSGYLFLDH